MVHPSAEGVPRSSASYWQPSHRWTFCFAFSQSTEDFFCGGHPVVGGLQGVYHGHRHRTGNRVIGGLSVCLQSITKDFFFCGGHPVAGGLQRVYYGHRHGTGNRVIVGLSGSLLSTTKDFCRGLQRVYHCYRHGTDNRVIV